MYFRRAKTYLKDNGFRPCSYFLYLVQDMLTVLQSSVIVNTVAVLPHADQYVGLASCCQGII